MCLTHILIAFTLIAMYAAKMYYSISRRIYALQE